MKLPLWIWDPKLGRYINIPQGMLRTYPDGKIGVDMGEQVGTEAVCFFQKHSYLFKADGYYQIPGTTRMGLTSWGAGRYVLKPPKRPKKQPWYAKQHIRGYQSE